MNWLKENWWKVVIVVGILALVGLSLAGRSGEQELAAYWKGENELCVQQLETLKTEARTAVRYYCGYIIEESGKRHPVKIGVLDGEGFSFKLPKGGELKMDSCSETSPLPKE